MHFEVEQDHQQLIKAGRKLSKPRDVQAEHHTAATQQPLGLPPKTAQASNML